MTRMSKFMRDFIDFCIHIPPRVGMPNKQRHIMPYKRESNLAYFLNGFSVIIIRNEFVHKSYINY